MAASRNKTFIHAYQGRCATELYDWGLRFIDRLLAAGEKVRSFPSTKEYRAADLKAIDKHGSSAHDLLFAIDVLLFVLGRLALYFFVVLQGAPPGGSAGKKKTMIFRLEFLLGAYPKHPTY